MRTLLLGATGLLGQAMAAEVARRGWPLVTAARSGADRTLDVRDGGALDTCLAEIRPELVINCVGLTDIRRCESDPGLAYAVNARPAALLAGWSWRERTRLIHVSTDHFFTTGGPTPHSENEPVDLVNEYARSKYAAEAFALTADRALVLRTSIVGIRGWTAPTLAEWAIAAALADDPVTLFTDAYTSSIDVRTFARAACDLALGPATGLLNLAAAEVYSKAQFVGEIAAQLDRPLDNARRASVADQRPPRPASLGLDVGRAQRLLDYPLPNLSGVVQSVLADHRERNAA